MLQRMVALFVPQEAVPADAQLDSRRSDDVDSLRSRDAHDDSNDVIHLLLYLSRSISRA